MAAQFRRRLRRGAATTAIAAVAMAALTASQAPDSQPGDPGASAGSPSEDHPIDGGSPYHTDLPPLRAPDKPGTSIDLPGLGGSESGIPATVLAAYKKAEAALADSNPGCNLPWELLAAIGKVESGQARGGAVDAEGTTLKPILGPQLNGNGFANISDTDGGTYDGDSTHDRAVGPMQFIPSTWMTWGTDGNADGEKDPNNIYDAALAAGRYLCAHGRDLSDKQDLDQAILGYNRSQEYLRTVLSWLEFYREGAHEVPDGSGVLPTTPGAGNGFTGNGPGGGGAGDGSGNGTGSGGSGDGDGGSGDGGSGDGGSGDDGSGNGGPGGGNGGSGEGSDRPTATASGSIGPGASPSASASPSPSESESEPGAGESENPECPTPSGSSSPSESTSPSGSESSGGSTEEPEDPCGEDGAEAKQADAQPSPSSSTGSAVGASAARLAT
ncbi:MAG TPA: hypothetical protein DEQ61_26090 [Streptomyces sp.]|nr:hypothetical protein [Streptomyces sp.]